MSRNSLAAIKADATAGGFSWFVAIHDNGTAGRLAGKPGVHRRVVGRWEGSSPGVWARPGVGLLFRCLPDSEEKVYYTAQLRILEEWLEAAYDPRSPHATVGDWLDLLAENWRQDLLPNPEGAVVQALLQVGATCEDALLLAEQSGGRRSFAEKWRRAWRDATRQARKQ